MGSEPETKEPRDTASMLFALMIAGIVVAAGAVAYVFYANSQRIKGGVPYAIAAGDVVTLDYIGRFSDGRVFDTSIWYVAQDDASYPKSLTFELKGNQSYQPFTMTAGDYGSSGGTIKGFALGVLGLHVGDYKIVEVPPEDGYQVQSSMISTVSLTDYVPIREYYSVQDFKSGFGSDPVPMATMSHYFWNWDVMVAEVSGEVVTVLNQPAVGGSVYPFGNPTDANEPAGWEVKVVMYDPLFEGGIGRITIQHMVSEEDVYNVKGTNGVGATFVISNFDATNGTFQIHIVDSDRGYNGEISGRALFFEITILKVAPVQS